MGRGRIFHPGGELLGALAECVLRMRRVSARGEGAGLHPGGVLCAEGLDSAACRLFQDILWSAVSAEVHALAGGHTAKGQALNAAHHIQWGEPLTHLFACTPAVCNPCNTLNLKRSACCIACVQFLSCLLQDAGSKCSAAVLPGFMEAHLQEVRPMLVLSHICHFLEIVVSSGQASPWKAEALHAVLTELLCVNACGTASVLSRI